MTSDLKLIMKKKLNVLMLYDANSTFTNTVRDYLLSFYHYSRHNIFFAHATHSAVCVVDLDNFDVVLIHYSVRLSLDWYLSKSYKNALQGFKGYKLLCIQDEYENTETARKWIEYLGINAVLTCVSPEFIDIVYPKKRFPQVSFRQVLTGYVPVNHPHLKQFYKPLQERSYAIGYRGRALPYWYGNLGQEKLIIAQKMKQICLEKGITINIEWDDNQRIYGDDWYKFLANCRATLGTESGANVFDEYGQIRKAIEKEQEKNPEVTYADVFSQYLASYENKVIMNQISPRIFEAIALKVALILFEGEYSGVVKPDVHYIPLKKDFSNIEEVLMKLQDDNYLNQLVERAYTDIIASEKYSYSQFVNEVDLFLDQSLPQKHDSNEFMPLMGMIWDSKQPEKKRKASLAYLPTNIPFKADQMRTLSLSKLFISPEGRLRLYIKKTISGVGKKIPRNLKQKIIEVPVLRKVLNLLG